MITKSAGNFFLKYNNLSLANLTKSIVSSYPKVIINKNLHYYCYGTFYVKVLCKSVRLKYCNNIKISSTYF